jgi:hypothetical protein
MDVDAFGTVVIVVSVTCAVISAVLFMRASRLYSLIGREGGLWLEHGSDDARRDAIREEVRQALDDRGVESRQSTASESRPGAPTAP